MKTKKEIRTTEILKVFMVLPLIAIALIAFSSCGKNKNTETTLTEMVPPPPPPPVPAADSAYTNVDEMPVFTGGDQAILKYIAENTKYPEVAKKNNIQGKVIVKMIVLKDGSVSNVEVLEGADPLLNIEAVRVVSSLPKFEKPGIKDGQPVAVYFMLPITFRLK